MTKPVVAESTTWYTVDEEALLSSAQLSNTKSSKKTTYDKGNDCRIVSIVKKKKTFVTSKSRIVLLR